MQAESIEDIRREIEERARCPRLKEGRYYRLPLLAGILGVPRKRIYGVLEELTTKTADTYNGTNTICADERLEALCRRWFVNVQIGERPPTLAEYPQVS